MKKTLIASAVAAATLSTSAFAMDPATDLAERLDSMPMFYGNVQLAYGYEDIDNNGAESSTNEFQDNDSTLGFKHDHEISDGLTGFLKVELEFDADDKGTSTGLSGFDEAYIGVKGDFGSAQFGSDDTVYEWVDVMDMYEFAGLEGDLATQDEGDNFQYYSPDMGGLSVGVTLPVDSDTTFGAALAGKYTLDNMEFVLAYGMGREEQGVEAGDAIGLAATIGIEDITLSAQFETKDESTSGAEDGLDYFGLMAQLAAGANNFAIGYQMKSFDPSAAEDEAGIYLQALHNVSDNMYVYTEYLMQTDVDGVDGSDKDTFALGATYAF